MNNIIRIAIFPPGTPRDIVLTTNGFVLDNYCTKAEGFIDLAGNFRIEASFINHKERPTIEKGHILKVTDENGEDEIFQITTYNPGLMITEIIGFQITITETQSLWLDDVRPTQTSGLGALQTLLDSSNSFGFKKEIFVNSDIQTINTAYYQDMNMFKAIHDCDQSFLSRWGGEVYRHQYNLYINQRVGNDRGIVIREGKNLTGFTANTNEDNLVTIAKGKGYNGIHGDYIESPLKNNYSRAFTKVIEYSDVKVRTESDADDEGFATLEEAQIELNRRIKEEFSKNHIDEIKATYNINFVQLALTEEYKNYAYLEKVDIGDTVSVIIDSLSITINTRVTEKKIDYLTGKIIELTLSNNPVDNIKSDSQVISDIKNILYKNNNSSLSEYIDSMMRASIKNSYAVYKENEALFMDNQDINLAKNVVIANKNGIGFSQNGYKGPYTYGFTIDGKLNASLIQTGILSTVLIQNADGSFKIDLSQSGGANFYNNGKKAINISNNEIDLYDWFHDGKFIGSLASMTRISNKDIALIQLANSKNSIVSIAYPNNNEYTSYIEFDKFNIAGNSFDKPIQVREETNFGWHFLYRARLSNDDKSGWIYVDEDRAEISIGDYFVHCMKDKVTMGKNKQSAITIKDDGIHFYGQLFRGD